MGEAKVVVAVLNRAQSAAARQPKVDTFAVAHVTAFVLAEYESGAEKVVVADAYTFPLPSIANPFGPVSPLSQSVLAIVCCDDDAFTN